MHTKCCEFRKFLRTKQRARLANTQFFLGKKCDVQLTATKWTNDKIHKHILVYLCACVCVCVSAAHAHLECVRIKQRANASLRVNVSVRILTSVYTGMWWAETCIPTCCACVCLCVRAYCCVGVHQFMTVCINIFLFLRWFDLSQYTQNTHRAMFDATIITYFYDCWLFFYCLPWSCQRLRQFARFLFASKLWLQMALSVSQRSRTIFEMKPIWMNFSGNMLIAYFANTILSANGFIFSPLWCCIPFVLGK